DSSVSRIWTTSLNASFFFSSRSRHTRSTRDWSSDVCSSDLGRLRDGCAGGEEIGQDTLARHDLEDAARAGEDHEGQRVRDALAEIGRASCRERGEVWGGGGGVKKRESGTGQMDKSSVER